MERVHPSGYFGFLKSQQEGHKQKYKISFISSLQKLPFKITPLLNMGLKDSDVLK